MDPRQPGYYPPANNNPYQYSQPPQQQQQPQFMHPDQIPQYANASHGRSNYGPPLQPINTHQSTYPQSDSLRSASTSASYQQQPSSVPISPNTFPGYSQNSAYPTPREQPTVPYPPPSPSQSEPQDEEEYRSRISGPAPEMHEYDDKKYGLVVVQQPIRARMCGFGDKDRRPITTPPIVRAVVIDNSTGEEVDYKACEDELCHFVVQTHIFDQEGRVEKSIVKTAPGQQIISATLASGYPSTTMNSVPSSPSRTAPRLPLEDTAYASAHGRHPSLNAQFAQPYNPSPYMNGANTIPGALFPIPAPPPMYSQMGGNNYGSYSGYPRGSMSGHAAGNSMLPTGPSQPPTPPLSKNEDSGPGYSRNLIGANTMSGQLLEDDKGKWGIFFCFTDLSVRSEDWFRLKFSLFNVGQNVTGLQDRDLFNLAQANNSAPSNEPDFTNTNRPAKKIDGLRGGLVAKTAPCLATVYSQAFKVYSAKKFPGVVDGTALSKKFAQQGVKISVRKDKTGGKRKRGDDDDVEEDDEYDGDNGEE